MRIGSDGTLARPDPDVIVSLDEEDVGVLLDALRFLLERCVEQDRTTVARTLAKVERIRADQEDETERGGER